MFKIPPGFVKPGDHIEKVVRFIAERGDYGPGDVEEHVRFHLARLSSGKPELREQSRADGQMVEVCRVPLPDGGYVSTRIDITAARRRERDFEAAQARLEHQNQVFSTLIENLPVAVSLVDADLKFTAFNRLFTEMFDLPPEFRPGALLEELARHNALRGEYGPGDIETHIRDRVAASIDPARRQFERRRPNGQVIDFRRTPLPGGGFVTTYIDVTQDREREAALEQARGRLERQTKELIATADKLNAANEAKSQFLANMSHELRTPLNAILGFSEAMREALFGPLAAKYKSYAGDIHASGSHLLRLINELLDLSKIEAGKLKLNEEEIDLLDVAEECQRLVIDRARQGSIDLQTQVPPELPRIMADRLRLKQVLLNLLSNAVKFTPPGGRVRLAGADLGRRGIEVTVADTGIGMDPRDVPLALQPFQQIDSRLTRRFEGAGLGLPLSKTFVEMHGGTFEITTAPARGTTVRIVLPAGRAVAAR
jgi:signal transduction histidine kinase